MCVRVRSLVFVRLTLHYFPRCLSSTNSIQFVSSEKTVSALPSMIRELAFGLVGKRLVDCKVIMNNNSLRYPFGFQIELLSNSLSLVVLIISYFLH